ncbi:calcium-responsive transactivator isoform X5 [Camelus ferus]|uniref:Calcium-responsive transactivator isoform X5 n=1 Tax=Camelus ferus TaxID=419612 RepID=A0A8B8RHF0_CAMFR|nr:calcium-responsive transactivator isoform X5 [Camelus ferus]
MVFVSPSVWPPWLVLVHLIYRLPRNAGAGHPSPLLGPGRWMLDENHHLIQCILDYQSKGKAAECTQYQQILHRNLVYLATIADSNQNMQSLLPAPPTQSMTLGPGGLSQSGSSQGLHSQGSLSDAIGAGLPPSSLMQAQIGNAGPNHVSMQQTAQSTLPTTSMSMSGSSHGSGPGYSHSGPASQSVPLQGQGTISNYVSRANINMQSNPVSMMHQQAASSHYGSAQGGSQHYQGQSMAMMGPSGQGSSMMGQRPLAPYRPSQQGSSQQYLGQEEYYGGEQYGHSQAASEPVSQPYYPDGHGDYAYQQSSYPEQSYDRPFEEPTQHYYEGGNSQYSQQQAGYQQGTAQQQTYSQQQYPNQQGYPGQQQGYGPAQGAPSQYSGYQQGQGQQYGSYRAAQTGPAAQQQRPYGYEQLCSLKRENATVIPKEFPTPSQQTQGRVFGKQTSLAFKNAARMLLVGVQDIESWRQRQGCLPLGASSGHPVRGRVRVQKRCEAPGPPTALSCCVTA